MHKFLIKDVIGIERDFGSSIRAAEFAKKFVGRDAVVAGHGKDTLWMLPSTVAYFSKLVGAELTVVNSAAALLDGEKASKAAAQVASNDRLVAKSNGRRVSHAKYGAGTVLGQDAKAVTVMFDSQKKPSRMLASVLTAI